MTAVPIRIVDPAVTTGAIPIRTAPAGLSGAVQVTIAPATLTGSLPCYYSSTNPTATPVIDVTPSVGYDAASTAYFAAMTTQPDATRKGLLDALIVGLKADGNFALLDRLVLTASHSAQSDLINIINPTQLLTEVGTVTHTTDRGITSDGTTGYMTVAADTSFTQATQDSAAYGLYMNTSVGVNPTAGLATSSNTRINVYTGTNVVARVNGPTSVAAAALDGLGLTTAVRSNSVTLSVYRGATQVATSGANTSATLTGETLQLLKTSSAFAASRMAVFFVGSGAVNVSALNSRLTTYLTAIGAN